MNWITAIRTSPAVAALIIACFSGPLTAETETGQAAVTDETTPSRAQLTLQDLRTFTDIFNQIRLNYVEEVDDKTLLNAAIRGMLSELDPHSSYLPEKDYSDLDDTARGRYSGIGVDIEPRDRKLVVRAIINGSPADKAGLNPGDVITSINGVPVRGRYLPEAIDELSGKPGTGISLTVISPGEAERDVEITREYIRLPTLNFELLDKSYGYFRMTHFHRQSASDFEQALESIAGDGIELNGLILDLRNNPGGVLQPAVAMADGFLDEGLIVSTRGRNESMQLEFEAKPGQWLPGIPVIVLVDRGSASASEVLAGALQDHGRALIVGERTFGKGSVQSVLPLRNGSGIKLTTARYYTPSGRSIQAEGIRPDVVVEQVEIVDDKDKRRREADLDRHLDNESAVKAVIPDVSVSPHDDFPLHEALSILKGAGILSGSVRAAREIPGDAQANEE